MNKRKTLKRNRTRKTLKRNGTRKNKKTKKRKNIKNKLGGTASASASSKKNENQVFSTGDLVKFKFNDIDQFAVVIDKLAVTEKDKYTVKLLKNSKDYNSKDYNSIYHEHPIFGKILLLEQMYMEKATDSELSEEQKISLQTIVTDVKEKVKTYNEFLS